MERTSTELFYNVHVINNTKLLTQTVSYSELAK